LNFDKFVKNSVANKNHNMVIEFENFLIRAGTQGSDNTSN